MPCTIMTLPFDTLIKIFKYLSLSDIGNVMLTCKKMKDLILNDITLWKYMCQQMVTVQNATDNIKTVTFSWYHQCRIAHNWCRGVYRDKLIKQHPTSYMPWLQFYNSEALILAIGSNLCCYSIFKKGNPSSKELSWKVEVPMTKRFDVRTNDVSRFVIRGKYLVCGNRDGSTAVYRLIFSSQKPKLLYYIPDCIENGQVEISAVEVINSQNKPHFVTASCNSSILSFWETKIDKGAYSHSIHSKHTKLENKFETKIAVTNGVRCLATNNVMNRLAIGLNDNSVPLVLDTSTGAFSSHVESVKDSRLAVRDIRWHDPNTILYVTHSGKLHMMDVRTEAVVYNASDPFQCTLYCVKSDGQRAILVGSSEYSRCVLYDSRNASQHVQMYFTQRKSSPVYCLDFDSTKLIAAADRSVAALNFNVNASNVCKRDYSQSFELIGSTSLNANFEEVLDANDLEFEI